MLERIKKELYQSSFYNKSENEASMQGQLTEHIQTKNKGMKYECNKCDKVYSNRGGLKTHKDTF